MAQFRATPADFDEVIANQQRQILRRQAPYALGALAAGMLLSFIFKPLALIAFGMAVAWSISIVLEIRSIRPAYLWRFAWAQEEAVVDIDDEGVRMTTAWGSGFIRWRDGVTVRPCSTCFVVEEEGEEIAVLPKQYLHSDELLVLQAKAPAAGALTLAP